MLAELSIKDLGVIRQASAELSEGLTVLTGETGAGKTMVVTGLRLLAGGRADVSRVRTGAAKAAVDGIFYLPEGSEAKEVEGLIEEAGGTVDEGQCIASRIVLATGRSKAHLGGRTVPAAILSDFSRRVLTVHGQNDQLRLLAPEEQLEALDRSDKAIGPLRERYTELFLRWRQLHKEYRQRTESRRELAQEVDRLNFALEEINSIDPQPGEDEELVEQIRRLQDVDSLREAALTALVAIDGEEGEGVQSAPASTQLGQAQAALNSTEDSELIGLGTRLSEITSQLGDISAELNRVLGELPADPNLLEKSLERQRDLRQLTRKYAADTAGVLKWREKAESKLASIDTSTEALTELKQQLVTAESEMIEAASALTSARKAAGDRLAESVTTEIQGLAMPKARMEVAIGKARFSKTGADEVELRLGAHPNAQAKPLASAASGGELSRVMLALEVILNAESTGSTLVFDEVDAGVGGRAAVEIGRRLARLAIDNQVIVVTHLPQVAAYADTHLHVAKDISEESVSSGVLTLNEEERVEELARMLAGLDDTATGRAHARELFDRARQEVAEQRK